MAVPVFANVSVVAPLGVPTGTLPNASGFGVIILTDPLAPFPWSVITCGEFEAVLMMVSVAVRSPVAVGVNVNEIGQGTWGTNSTPLKSPTHPPIVVSKKNEKSVGFAPPRTAFAVSTSGRVPVSVNVATCGLLDVPINVLGNVTVAGATAAVVGLIPEPVSVTVCGTPIAPAVVLVT